ncbi:hypothetical protein B0H63DRAFT_444480 [Podospora didyma]|uniref:Uncharacterized protein n=1 Tax=Podospora didyma TaxID=330526 RepID=A0AAE0U840_9PEZI|nr:hypothetical protein B0H63DRAFT_444480 [Podospora didyma]
MRFTSVILAGVFAAVASAIDQTAASTSAAPAPTVSQDPQQAAITRCLSACNPGDVNCTSKCIAVPNPDVSQVEATNQCVGNCTQGNGSAGETLAYENCVSACIGKHFYTASVGTPDPSGVANKDAAAGGTGVATFQVGKATGTGTRTLSGFETGTETATSSSSSGAATALHVAGSVVGALGFLTALLAI